ncbi:MAG: LacI family DNA-binding transcriptional regulator [bacterium]|nr:LacI family DNA-binding transcriptional regulator [bacterium]
METKTTTKKITLNEIANELGYSKSTISRAISGNGRISQEVREEVLAFCKKYDYKPNSIAKGLAKSKTYNISVVLPADQDLNEIPFFQHCLLGICEMATSMDYDVIVTTINTDDISRLKRIVENKKVDGVILTRTVTSDPQEEFLMKSNVPFVVIGSSEHDSIIQVDNDHVEACKELTSLLIAQKTHELAFVGCNSNHIVSKKRYQGFLEGCSEQQLIPRKDMVYLECNTKLMVEKAVNEILANHMECIVCMDDKICHQVLQKLNDEQVVIPNEIKVASFYDNALLESYTPGITALKFDTKALGIECCRVLLDLIDGRQVSNRTLLGYDIVLRGSTKQVTVLGREGEKI